MGFWGYCIGILIYGLIFGFATRIVIENKGYDDNWFWWGFFFGFIALIVACAKPQNISYSSDFTATRYASPPSAYGTGLAQATHESDTQKMIAAGGWTCTCGRTNAAYVSTCSCGRNKRDVLAAQNKKASQGIDTTESSKIEAIKEYKRLMDEGIISQQEFDAKKKQLLGS